MRNLDEINPAFLRPSRFSIFSAFTSGALVLLSIPLAYSAAPTIPLSENVIVLFLVAIFSLSLVLALMAFILDWGWKTSYYGTSLLCLGCISFLAIVPCLALMLYSSASYWIKLLIVSIYIISHVMWCRRFTKVYRRIFDDVNMRSMIYAESSEAVYYVRSVDDFLIEKKCKFEQIPQARYFVIFMVLAIALIPAMNTVAGVTNLPFVHSFLIVAMLPVSWMSIGLAVRAYLIFYFYPARIKRETGKEVYVDLVSNVSHQLPSRP